MVTLGDVFRAVRVEAKLTQEQVASRAGVKIDMVRRAERRPYSLRLGVLVKIAAAAEQDIGKMMRYAGKGLNTHAGGGSAESR